MDHKAFLASLPAPTTKAKILSFLSLAGYLRAWVPIFSLMAKPLYKTSKGPIQEPLDPPWPVSGHFKSLLQALVLPLLDFTYPFFLYVSERQGFALGVLGHNIGPSFAPVAYLSKQLVPTTRGWTPCLRALAAASLLIQESKKLTFGSPLTIYSSHSLLELLTYKELHSMTPSRTLSLQVALVEDPTLTFTSNSVALMSL
jgi:hypothetical protein